MIEAVIDPTFESWQARARSLAAASVRPDGILWLVRGSEPLLPFAAAPVPTGPSRELRVPKRFVELGSLAAGNAAPDRWSLLYRVLWRLLHESRRLLDHDADPDIVRLRGLVQQVRHDMHRMQAFLRFRAVIDEGAERLVGWYAPDHDVAALVAPHFAERYPHERWSIFTPQASVHCAEGALTTAPGVPRASLPADDSNDAAEALWRVYYASVFNPARLNERKLRRDLPARIWDSIPEATEIPALIAEAPARAAKLRASSGGVTDRAAVPATTDLNALRAAAACCRSCPLHERATRTVFGEGPSDAAIVLVGEQPGDAEDLGGKPFVGPAGAVLDRALADARIDRARVYLTNAVKHFGWEPRGKRRIHRTPRLSEIQACRPWVERELAAVKPRVLVLLGGVAARSLLGPQARISAMRGTVRTASWAPFVVVTYHPSAVLRAADAETGDRTYACLVSDLRRAASCLQDPSAVAG